MKKYGKIKILKRTNKSLVGIITALFLVSLLMFSAIPTEASTDCSPRLISFLEEDASGGQMKGVTDDTSGWSHDGGTKNLGVQKINLTVGTAYAYENGCDDIFSHRGTRGLGCWGEENDEVDCIDLTERIEIEFDQDEYINKFEIRSLFYKDTGDFKEVADVDLYLDGNLIEEYDLEGQQPLSDPNNNGVVEVTIDPAKKIDKMKFYVDQSKTHSTESEFAVARIWLNENISPTMDPIAEPENMCYNTAPILSHIGFDDNCNLDDGYYQIDSYSQNGWQVIFENHPDPSYDESNWEIPGFAGLSEGMHTVYFMADDDAHNPNGTDGSWSWSFCKDTTGPDVYVDLGQPQMMADGPQGNLPLIGSNTPVWINATDSGCSDGVELIKYSTSPGVWTTVYDGEEGVDLDEDYGEISVKLFFDDYSCWHEIDYDAKDYCENWAGVNDYDFYVDIDSPVTDYSIIGPEKLNPESEDWTWFGPCTWKWINTSDSGCIDGGSGVDTLYIEISTNNTPSGNWEVQEYYEIDDNDQTGIYPDLDPTVGVVKTKIHITNDCWHWIKHWCVDKVENMEETTVPHNKQKHKVDATPPTTSLNQQWQCVKDENEYCIKTDEQISITVENSGTEPCIYQDYWGAFRIYVEDEDQWYPSEGHLAYANYD
ncbi:MAG: hypothetical protein V5A68_08410, partial [Candidatus Thermoplasmatota archaeon]